MGNIVKISDSTNTTSSITAASSTAVKNAYDLASTKVNSTNGTMSFDLDTHHAEFRRAGAEGNYNVSLVVNKIGETTYSYNTILDKNGKFLPGFITGLSISGKTITVTKGDGSTSTLTTQDTNTTYSNMTAATASAAGKAGLVPAPAAGKQASFLRGDGTWVVPTNTTYSAGTGLSLSSNKFSLATVVTAGNAGPTANASPAFGGSFTVPYITYDAYGRVTGRTNRTITLPADANIMAASHFTTSFTLPAGGTWSYYWIGATADSYFFNTGDVGTVAGGTTITPSQGYGGIYIAFKRS